MSAFYIWNPYILPNSKKLEFILTNGDTGYGIFRDKEFVENLLPDLKIKAKIETWSLLPYRSNYYSEYLDEDDWRDRWQIIWKFSILMEEYFVKLPAITIPWIATNATGQKWWNGPDDNDSINCLVVSDFNSNSKLREAQQAITQEKKLALFRKKYSVRLPKFSYSEVLGKYKQLQIDLDLFPAIFFEQGADYAEEVLELCKQFNGTIHYQEHE